ncbi:DOMON-like domain-containing protein [Kaarinaea lacus]
MDSITFSLQPFDSSITENLPISVTGTCRLRDNQIDICYRISGAIQKIQFPALSQRPSRKDQLWNSTCCELFVGASDKSTYWEYNLSPSHDWAIFGFTDYRENKTDELSVSVLEVNTEFDNDKEYGLNSILTLPDALVGQNLDIGISMVIQDKAGNPHYYALSHPGARPDFHDRKCFSIHADIDGLTN